MRLKKEARNIKNNKGYSLAELMVVVAILALCVSIVGFSISSVSMSQAKKCAREMDALISKCKIGAMSREDQVYIEFSSVGGKVVGAYYEGNEEDGFTQISRETLSSRKISVTYTASDERGGTSTFELESRPLRLSFYKDTGALYSLNDTPGSTGSYETGAYCKSLTISGGGTEMEILLTPSTGSHVLQGVG